MRNALIFILAWLLILIAVLQQWVILAWCVTVLFSMKYPTHSLILLGILVDGYFGAFYYIPVFSLLALLWFLLFESLRDQLNIRQVNDKCS